MAKILQWTDDAGNEYPESCWIPVFQAVDYPKAARFVFFGFKDKFAAASYLATGSPAPIPGATKEYTVPADKVREVCGPLLAQVTELIYDYAATVADVADPLPGDPGKGIPPDPDHKVPFFYEAPNVELPQAPAQTVANQHLAAPTPRGNRRGK